MKLNTILGTIGLSLISLASATAENVHIAVKENKVACYGNQNDCLLIKTGKQLDWRSFSDDIAGFNYEEGFRYLLQVDKTPKKGSKTEFDYKLIKIVKQEAFALAPHASFDQINNKKWYLTYFNEQDVESEGLTVEIFTDRLAIRGLCNNYYAYHTVSNKTINTGRTVGTMMACSEQSDLENKFIKAFDNKNLTYEINGNNVLFYNKGVHTMTFTDKLDNKELDNLERSDWRLYQYDSTLVTNQSIKTRLSFNAEDKRIYGEDGCNNFKGTFSIVKNTITFDAVGTTRKGCINEASNTVSRQFNRLFNTKGLTFSFTDNKLHFHQDGKIIFTFVKQNKEK